MENIILDAEEFSEIHDYRDYLAPKWKRLINLFFDYHVTFLVILFCVFMLDENLELNAIPDYVLIIIIPLISVFTIYFFTELYFGKTLGKLITGTKVISVFDEPLTTKQILLRTVCRIIPFEPFSLLFSYTAWHDDWSDTAVVNKNYQTSY